MELFMTLLWLYFGVSIGLGLLAVIKIRYDRWRYPSVVDKDSLAYAIAILLFCPVLNLVWIVGYVIGQLRPAPSHHRK